MMRPKPSRGRNGSAALVIGTTPNESVDICQSDSSSDVSSVAPNSPDPGLVDTHIEPTHLFEHGRGTGGHAGDIRSDCRRK